ncbi:MAG: hypothetical protein R6X15_09480 [Pseudomonadota bacterium]
MDNKARRAGIALATIAAKMEHDITQAGKPIHKKDFVASTLSKLKSLNALSGVRHIKLTVDETITSIVDEAEPDYSAIMQPYLQEVPDKDKKEVLYCALYLLEITDEADKEHKEIVSSLCHMLDIRDDFFDVMDGFHKSGFEGKSDIKLIAGSVIGMLVLLVILVYSIRGTDDVDVNVFATNRVDFLNVPFNQYVVYQNRFEGSDWFKKRAVLYVHGNTSVGFEPEHLSYNETTGNVHVNMNLAKLLVTETSANVELIDQIDPREISEEEAQSIAIGIGFTTGLVGAVSGAAVGAQVSGVLPGVSAIQSGAVSAGVTGVGLGAGGYVLGSKVLEGASITKEISPIERDTVFRESKKIITGLLSPEYQLVENNSELGHIYKAHFERFVKARYAQRGLEIEIVYEQGVYGND